jgi:methylase of polypeptide subunit release factors
MMQAVAYRKLSELVDRFGGGKSVKADLWAKQLFESLDWGDRPTFSIKPDNGQGYRLLVDNFPAVNILTESPNNIESVYRALNRAYNQDVPWVVATDFYSLGLFGSYWVSFPHDIESALALKIDHSEYLAEAHQLEILTPQSVARNDLNELYSTFRGRKRRIPIDRHLVERMVRWRHLGLEALKASDSDTDQLIHRLINSLFLIRYLEDTNKTSETPLIEIANLQNDDQFISHLWTILDHTAKRTGYTVPNRHELINLNQTPLKHLIRELYGYPDYGITYDFAAMNVDVLGRFYEEYLRTDVVPTRETKAVLTLFPPPTYEMDDVRRQRGVYFTPRYIVDFILNSLIERFKDHSPKTLPTVVDIAVGSATFLSAAVDHLVKAYPKAKHEPTEFANHLIGIDVDPRAIEAARLNLTAKLIGEGVPEPLPPLSLKKADLIFLGPLQSDIRGILPAAGADIIVGNPPFIQYERLKKHYDVSDFSAVFETAIGRTDSYIMFVEAAVKLLKDGGFGGLVLPNSILRTQAAAPLREWITKRADILEIVDFLEQPVFQAVNAYVCLLLFRKRSSTETANRDVTVAKVYKLSETPGSQLASISVSEEPPEGCEVFRIPQPSGRGPWTLRNKAEIELLEIIKNASDDTVGNVLLLRQGIKTGADQIFVVEASPLNEELYVITGKEGSHKIERELLLPAFRIRDLRRWSATAPAFLIYPYDKEREKAIDWKTLQKKYPATAAYLESNRTKLSQRRSLVGKRWYELIRDRLQTVTDEAPRLVAAEIGLRPIICRPHPHDAAIIGNAWLILNNEAYDLDVLMAYLNSSVAEWYLRHVSPLLQGGYILLRQTNISKLPLPRFLKDSDAFIHGELKALSKSLAEKTLKSGTPNHASIKIEIKRTEDHIDSLIMDALDLKVFHAEQLRKTVSVSRRAASRAK